MFNISMSNEMALQILPFGTGYFLNEEGNPDPDSLGVAMTFQTLVTFINPHSLPKVYDN